MKNLRKISLTLILTLISILLLAVSSKAATKDNIVYPSYDPCIFEVRYPETDIVGRVVSL